MYRRRVGSIRWLAIIFVASCIDDHLVICGDLACAPGLVCTGAGACATLENAAACNGLDEGAACLSPDVPIGSCRDGACSSAYCGNNFVDEGEACDDGNTASGDNCSNDCGSDETCGNAITDLAANEQCDDGNDLAGDGCTSLCAFEIGLWRDVSPKPPPARVLGGLSIDASGRLLLFNGSSFSFLGRPDDEKMWSWDGATWIPRTAPVHLPPRSRFAYAFDSVRKRIVVFGGIDAAGVPTTETWEWDGVSWEQRLPVTSPPPLVWTAMAYDPNRERTVLFGGDIGGGPSDEMWEWDGTTWLRQTPSNPPPARQQAAMAFDPVRDVIVLTGGIDVSGVQLGDTWEWNGAMWTSAPAAPPSNFGTLVWDPDGSRLVLVHSNGTIAIRSGSTWTSTTTPGAVTAYIPAAAYDPSTSAIVAYGGFRGGFVAASEAYTWNGLDNWTPLTSFLGPLRLDSATYDAMRGRVVAMYRTELYELDGAAWIPRNTASDPTFSGVPALAYVESRRHTLLAAIDTDSNAISTFRTWSWDGATWTLLATSGPPPRGGYAITYDSARDRVVLFTNRASTTETTPNETWEWDGTSWSLVAAAGGPIARTGHELAYDAVRRRVVLYGGAGDQGEVWEYDGTVWSQVTATAAPPLRTRHALAYDPLRQRVVLFGGAPSGPTGRSDLWDWDGVTWTQRAPIVLPPGRIDPVLAHDITGGLVLACGSNNNLPRSDTWRFRFESASAPAETCRIATADTDNDGDAGCADGDCWLRCSPHCPPGTSCATTAPRCGDLACGAVEDYALCPSDCSAP